MPNGLVTATALLCFGSALAATAWSRVRIAASRLRAEELLRRLPQTGPADRGEAGCEAAREVQ